MKFFRLTNFFRIETLEEEGDVGAGGDGDAKIEAGLTLLAGDVDDSCRWICSPEAKTPPPVVLDAHDSCGLFVQAERKKKLEHYEERLDQREI